jgi:hypothetical protein
MRKDKIVLYRETWEESLSLKRELVCDYRNEREENKKLQNENGYLKALFDKEGDTQVIKYNGKLYRITSMTNYVEAGVEETLDFTAVPVREVN